MTKPKGSKGYTDEDLAEVSDNPEWTEEDFKNAKPFAEVFPELAESIHRSRGPQKAPTKVAVSIRLSQEVLAYYKAQGDKWQSRIDQDLRKIVARKR
jgi:uncharacterized protein (DUF4415 family)